MDAVLLVILEGLSGADCLGSVNDVSYRHLDHIAHLFAVFGVSEIGDSVHASINKAFPERSLEDSKVSGRFELGTKPCPLMIVSLLSCRCIDRSELVRRRVLGCWDCKTSLVTAWFSTCPGEPIVFD